jgi:hypothetical protein
MLAASVAVAAALEQPLWPAALGAGLVLGYWALEALAYRRSRRASFSGAVAVAVGGAALRMAAVLGCLVLVGVLARPVFAEVALAFLASFTVYLGLRIYAFAGEPEVTPQAGSR